MPKTSIDSDAIDTAYQNKLGDLYAVLVRNLIESPDDEQRSLKQFTTGLNVARRARDLANTAIKDSAVASK